MRQWPLVNVQKLVGGMRLESTFGRLNCSGLWRWVYQVRVTVNVGMADRDSFWYTSDSLLLRPIPIRFASALINGGIIEVIYGSYILDAGAIESGPLIGRNLLPSIRVPYAQRR